MFERIPDEVPVIAKRRIKSHNVRVESVNHGTELSDANPSGSLATGVSGLSGSEGSGGDDGNHATVISISEALVPLEEVYPGGLGAVGEE